MYVSSFYSESGLLKQVCAYPVLRMRRPRLRDTRELGQGRTASRGALGPDFPCKDHVSAPPPSHSPSMGSKLLSLRAQAIPVRCSPCAFHEVFAPLGISISIRKSLFGNRCLEYVISSPWRQSSSFLYNKPRTCGPPSALPDILPAAGRTGRHRTHTHTHTHFVH